MSFGFTNPVIPWYYRGDTRLVKPGQHRIFSLREGGSQFFMGSITEILPWLHRDITMHTSLSVPRWEIYATGTVTMIQHWNRRLLGPI